MKIIPCICDSGLLAPFCCWQTDRWYKTPASTKPPGPVTGYSHPKCYAGATGNCSEGISGEHFISHAILRSIGADGVNMVAGMHWQSGRSIVPGKRLTAKILCVRHNNALSPIDQEGSRLFHTLDRFQKELMHKADWVKSEEKLFNGEDIERYLIKCACGYIKAGNVTNLSINDNDPLPGTWINVLFRDESLLPEFGMRLLKPDPTKTPSGAAVSCGVWQNDHSRQDSIGTLANMGAFTFWHTPFPGIDPIKQHSDQASKWRLSKKQAKVVEHFSRPGSITLRAKNVQKTVRFSWNDGRRHEDLYFEVKQHKV